jgi:TPR repeat protein
MLGAMYCVQDTPPVVRPPAGKARVHWLPVNQSWEATLKAWVDSYLYSEAIPWLLPSRRQPWAQALLGEIRLRDPETAHKAFAWLKRAASQCAGNHPAVLRLARCYQQGIGVAANAFMARHWYLRAARCEVAEAFEPLGDIEANGFLHPVNRVRAGMWYAIGCAQLEDKDRVGELQNKMLELLWIYPEPERSRAIDRCFDNGLQWMADNWND